MIDRDSEHWSFVDPVLGTPDWRIPPAPPNPTRPKLSAMEILGRLVFAHYQSKARDTDYLRLVERLKKQGWTEEMVILALTGKEPRP